MRVQRFLVSAAVSCAVLTAYAQAPETPPSPLRTLRPVQNFVTVTDQIMRAPKPEDWLIHRGNYQAWGYSPLDQINKTNVKNLQLVWSRAMEPGINQATPLVYNGVMYLGNPGDVIQAIDAATGDLMWEYRHPLPPATSFRNHLGQRKRSIALYGDNVYTVTWDNVVVALEARTGNVAWQTDRGGDFYVSNSTGPIVANGVVVAGSTCQVARHGCYVTGHDAKTGKELWRNEMIPRPGEPGDETWAGSPFESRWMTGVWGQLTYDPELDLVFYGSSGVGPASEAQRKMPGATMAGTNTRFAVRPKTGEVVWKHQVLPRDNWDQECTFEMMIINTPVNPDRAGMLAVNPDARRGPRKTLTGVPCKTGIAWSFDAATGEFLWAKPTVEQNLVARIDAEGARHRQRGRRAQGGRQDLSHLPDLQRRPRLAARRLQSEIQRHVHAAVESLHRLDGAHRSRAAPQFVYNTTNVGKFAAGKDKVGRIDAISVETGKTLWSWETRVSNYSPILATGGGLLFNGSMDRYLRALDADKGRSCGRRGFPRKPSAAP